MLAAQALVTWGAPFRRLLGTSPLGVADLLVVALGTLIPLAVNELTKPIRPAISGGSIDQPIVDRDDASDEAGADSRTQVSEVAST